MDGYSYVNIFSTKGVEYLIVIGFFILIVPFWRLLKETEVPIPALARIRLPKGVYFNPTHTWAFLEVAGRIRVGIDDFMANITGPLGVRYLKNTGDHVVRGEAISCLEVDGKRLQVYSPISGTVSRINRGTARRFGKTTNSEFTDNWLLKITPDHWEQDREVMYAGKQARSWISKELTRLRDFIAFANHKYFDNAAPVLLQEGGEIDDQLLAQLPPEIWTEFQFEFIDAAKVV